MINPTRLNQINHAANSRTTKDDARTLEAALPGINDTNSPMEKILGSESLGLNAGNLGGTSPFSELLQQSKLESQKTLDTAKKADEKKVEKSTNKGDKSEKSTDIAQQRAKPKKDQSKDAKSKNLKNNQDVNDEQRTLSQLLSFQQAKNPQNEINPALQNQIKNDEFSSSERSIQDVQSQIGKADPAHNLSDRDQQYGKKNKGTEDLFNQNDLLDFSKDGELFGNNENLKKNILKDLKEMDKISEKQEFMMSNEKNKTNQIQNDELSNLASKFDDVKFEFNSGQDQQSSRIQNIALAKEIEAKELAQKMAEQEWLQNDNTLRDMLHRNASENAALEQLTLDRLEAMSRVKELQQEKIQAQNLQSGALERQAQNHETQATKQSQWRALDELSPDQLAIIDSLKGLNQENTEARNSQDVTVANRSSIANRLATNGESTSGPQKLTSQETMLAMNTAARIQGEGQPTNTSGGQGSFAEHSDRGGTSSISGPNTNQSEKLTRGRDSESIDNQSDKKKAQQQDRSREMARAAALRAQSIASELAAKGGGSARVQIKDSQLGVVELRVNMTDRNRMNVELIANTERIKQELEKQTEELKSGFEKHQVILEGVQFSTDSKLGESGFQNSNQNENKGQNQFQQQNFNSFSQNSSSQGQQGSNPERTFELANTPINANLNKSSARKDYSGKNEPKTNVQRDANGSLKVSA